jgi:hypothetical protein
MPIKPQESSIVEPDLAVRAQSCCTVDAGLTELENRHVNVNLRIVFRFFSI